MERLWREQGSYGKKLSEGKPKQVNPERGGGYCKRYIRKEGRERAKRQSAEPGLIRNPRASRSKRSAQRIYRKIAGTASSRLPKSRSSAQTPETEVTTLHTSGPALGGGSGGADGEEALF